MRKSVINKLKKTGLSEESMDFLLQFYAGAINAYGIISLEDLYGLYKDIKKQNQAYPEITFDQFVSFGEITETNMDVDFYLFSAEAINKYCNDSGIPLTSPLLVHEQIAWKENSLQGIWYVYMNLCEFSSKFYLTPNDLRDFAKHEETADEKALKKALSELKSSGMTLNKAPSRIRFGDTALYEIIAFTQYAYQTSQGDLNAAAEELDELSDTYHFDYGKHTFAEICTLMDRALYDLPCWGMGGYTYGQMMGIPKEELSKNDFSVDDDDLDDDSFSFLDQVHDLDNKGYILSNLLMDLISNDQPVDKTVKKVSYPKRLLDKTMKKRYADAGFDSEKLDFLHKLFQSAANLYGVITIDSIKQIYQELKDKNSYPTIRKEELTKFAELVRREDVPYYIFEQHDLFRNRENSPLDRVLVNADVLGPNGLHSLEGIYNIYYSEYAKYYWLPKDILTFTDQQQVQEELDLLAYFTQLGSKDEKIVSLESKELAKKIVNNIIWTCKCGLQSVDPIPSKEWNQLLTNGGKEVSPNVEDKIVDLISNYDQNRHYYTLKGWTSDEWKANPNAMGYQAYKEEMLDMVLNKLKNKDPE